MPGCGVVAIDLGASRGKLGFSNKGSWMLGGQKQQIPETVISFCGKRELVAFGVGVAAGDSFILFCLSVRPGSFVGVRVCLLGDDFVLGV